MTLPTSIPTSLAAKLKEVAELHNPRLTSADDTPFPLWAILLLLYKSNIPIFGKENLRVAEWFKPIRYKHYPELDFAKSYQSVAALESSNWMSIPVHDITMCFYQEVLPILGYKPRHIAERISYVNTSS